METEFVRSHSKNVITEMEFLRSMCKNIIIGMMFIKASKEDLSTQKSC